MKKIEYIITDEQVKKRASASVKIAIEKKRAIDASVIVYDRKEKCIYKLNSDGTRTRLTENISRGRYSERIKNTEA